MNIETDKGEEVRKNLSLNPKNEEGIYTIIKSDGKKYSVRSDRRRYFFPHEWKAFVKTLDTDSKHYILFLISLHSGARIMEVLHLKPINFDFERKTITLEVIKQRKAKKNFYATGKSRTFFISENCLSEVKRYIKKNNIPPNSYLFLDNEKLPGNYDSLSNTEKKKYYQNTEIAYAQMFKRKVKKAGISDWKQFSLHNIRKTYGNWMRLYEIRMEEICYRMGHDFETYLTHYGSSLIFNPNEKMDIMKIMGDIK
jgi:integrase